MSISHQHNEDSTLKSQGEAEEIYHSLESYREPFLTRGREAAAVTLPYLLPKEGHSNSTSFNFPVQSAGARGVRNIASKLLIAILPPNSSFFRLGLSEKEKKESREEVGDVETTALSEELDKALTEIESIATKEIAARPFRSKVFEIMKSLVTVGNRLVHFDDQNGGTFRTFRLDQYVVKRDGMGNPTHIAVKESLAPETLSDEFRVQLESSNTQEPEKANAFEDTVNLFTGCVREDEKTWRVFQDAQGIKLYEETFKPEEFPFYPLRYSQIDGEDYGRGLVEELQGDLTTLEGLQRALNLGAAAASKILFFVDPNGNTEITAIQQSQSGDVLSGNAEEITKLQLDKYADFTFVENNARKIEDRLNGSFLLTTAAVRQAERVTAEEIRMITQELESALGGLYSLLAEEFQLPFVRHLLKKLAKEGILPKIDDEAITPIITTGVEALGRTNDLQKLDAWVAGGVSVVPDVAMAIKKEAFMQKRANALNLDVSGILKTSEELAQEAQQMQLSTMLENATPGATKGIADMAVQERQSQIQDEQSE